MKLSLKYKFILSFVTLEIFFISLIVFFNFSSLNNLSNTLIRNNIEASSKLFIALIKTPLIIDDLATLDNAVESLINMKNVVAIHIKNAENVLLSHADKNSSIYENISNENQEVKINNKIFKPVLLTIDIDGEIIAHAQIIYDLTDILTMTKDNRNMTFFLMALEILLSTIIAYMIGYKLTNRLAILTLSAEQISQNNQVVIANDGKSRDEVSILANAFEVMQKSIFQRDKELKKLIQKLQHSSTQLRIQRDFHTAMINNSTSAVMVLDNKCEIYAVNKTVENLTGYSEAELKGQSILNLLKNANINVKFSGLTVSYFPHEYENSLITKDQIDTPFEWSNSCTFNQDGEIEYIVSVGVNISSLKQVQYELEKYINLVNENIIISRTDLNGVITDVSKAFCEISGYSSDELIGHSHAIMRHVDTPIEVYEDLWKTILSGKVWKSEVKNRTKEGSFYWTNSAIYPDYDYDGKIYGYYAIRHDITDKKDIEKLSLTDSLTKLYNRRHFDGLFEKEANRAKRDRAIFCLASLDVDYFKIYNDTYGHQEGDKVLKSIGGILKSNMQRAGDLAFRMGGEEFSVIFTVSNGEDIYSFTENIRKSIEDKKIEHKGNTASSYITISIGVAFINFKNNFNAVIDKSVLYKDADELLYKAKNSGRNTIIIKEKQ